MMTHGSPFLTEFTIPKGEKIGPIFTVSSPLPGFTVAYAKSGSTGFFEIRIKYDEQDIISYDLYIALEPYETTPP
ncbi:MAG: hypothetical protein QW222_03505 [Candidatus Bathyarchaeia archaeon]